MGAVSVTVIAAYLRLRALGYSPIGGDQSILLSIALRFVNQGQPMLPLAANKSSAGIMNPPLIEYLLALPLWVQKTLTAVHVFQALLSISAVVVLYIAAHWLFGRRVAVVSGLLFAVSPWAVYYGRFIWNPNPIPFFSTLLLVSLLACCVSSPNRTAVFLPLAFLWLAAITQLHLSSFVMLGVMGLVLLIFWQRWGQKGWQQKTAVLGLGLLLALLLYVPFLIYEQAVGFTDLQTFAAALLGNSQTAVSGEVGAPEVNLASWLLTAELATGQNIFAATEIPKEAVWPWFSFSDAAQVVFSLCLLYGLSMPIYWRLRYKGQPLPPHYTALFITALWIVVPVLFYLRHTIYLQNYYFLYLFPAPFLLVALTLDDLIFLIPNSPLSLRSSLFALLSFPVLLFCLWQFQVMHTYANALETEQIEVQRPFLHLQNAIHTTQNVLVRYPTCHLAIVAEGGTAETSSLSLVENFVYPQPVRFIGRGQGYIVPANCMVYLLAGEDAVVESWLAGAGTLLPEQAQLGPETWRFYDVPETAVSLSPALAAWQNGLSLLDAQINGELAANNGLTLQYTWHVATPPPSGAHYHFFNHLLNSDGELVAQIDAPAIDSLYWQPGDQLVTEFYLHLPAEVANGPYTLAVGLYTWPDLQRIPLADGQTSYTVEQLVIE